MQGAVVTLVPDRAPQQTRRAIDERLMVRFPSAFRVLSALGVRVLPPRSRLRRAMLRRQMRSAYAASSRRDFELMLVRYAPDVRVETQFGALDLDGTFHGHEGVLHVIGTFGAAWDRWELRPTAVIDLGESLLALGRFHLPANESGLEFAPEFSQIVTIRGGLIVLDREFLSWEDGLRAAGLDPALIGSAVQRSAEHGAQ
jgi:ketosteroid isomerase-like protein